MRYLFGLGAFILGSTALADGFDVPCSAPSRSCMQTPGCPTCYDVACDDWRSCHDACNGNQACKDACEAAYILQSGLCEISQSYRDAIGVAATPSPADTLWALLSLEGGINIILDNPDLLLGAMKIASESRT